MQKKLVMINNFYKNIYQLYSTFYLLKSYILLTIYSNLCSEHIYYLLIIFVFTVKFVRFGQEVWNYWSGNMVIKEFLIKCGLDLSKFYNPFLNKNEFHRSSLKIPGIKK